ncbi:SAM-dependent methyltransferase [Streptomyces purpureus]|uniref:S-adenosyl-L-methionine-dependent methyltransferase n=1 Tax=Streptomyces purpureus TaxID=1951 RepID=A0A918GXQ0_9ACTN|nr:SAM-dependent methyltransferase [Streptomyces purpureus]GGT18335.1 S-adenosyl-L-methionine-dependent methyltransferase [Streptomyces purpureus]
MSDNDNQDAETPSGPLAGVSQTALWTARMRAQEAAKDAPCVEDPWAARFLTAAGETTRPPGSGLLQDVLPDWIAVRTRFFDDFLLAATGAGCRQVVILGAGLDARAHRLDWPDGVRVFEVDLAPVHAFKAAALAGARPERAERVAVPADLLGPWDLALKDAGHDPAAPTAWLCEGLLFYLEPEQVAGVVETVGGLSAPGSRIGAECLNAAAAESAFMGPWLEALSASGTPWRWQLPADWETWWARYGWTARAADLFELPYAVERFSAYRQFLEGSDNESMRLITGVRS